MGTISEQASKALLAPHGVPFLDERSVADPDAAVSAADELGLPVVVKLNGDAIAHKTERGLVRLGLGSREAVAAAATELLAAATPEDGDVSLLVAPMIRSNREFICGASTDPQFGPTVLLGVGGILAEAIADVSIRLAPISAVDAEEMIDQLRTQDLLGSFRGEEAIDRQGLVDTLLALSSAISDHPEIVSIDLNPVLIHGGAPVAVDALVEVDRSEGAS
jgi:acetyl-CoA synthetase (ADP-forming)